MKIELINGNGQVALTNAAGETMNVSVMEFWEICRFGDRLDALQEVEDYLSDTVDVDGVDADYIKNDPVLMNEVVERLMEARLNRESGAQVYDALESCVDDLKNLVSFNMVKAGYAAGLVRLMDSPHDDGVVCGIGEHWFYFGGEEAEGCSVEEYKANVPESTIIEEIFNVLDDFEGNGLDWDEYRYYGYYLSEQLPAVENQMTVKELIADACERSAPADGRDSKDFDFSK